MGNNADSLEMLKAGIESLGIMSGQQRINTLMAYLEEIRYWNHRYRMIANCEDLVSRHILDSLAGLSTIKRFSPRIIADVGAGAGFPGIPLAVWMEDVNFLLIERSEKKAGFLRNVIVSLCLTNVLVSETPFEQTTVDAPVDLIVFRAMAKLSKKLIEHLIPLLNSDGTIIAYKGKLSTTKKEIEAISSHWHTEIRPVTVPGLEKERCLVTIKPIG